LAVARLSENELLLGGDGPLAGSYRPGGLVRGTIFFPTSGHLPSDTRVEVALVDRNTLSDLARQVVTAPPQVPIPFELAYDRARVDPSHEVGVEAHVYWDGRLQFATPAPWRALTLGNPDRLALILDPQE
jgi:putative lipoprotein